MPIDNHPLTQRRLQLIGIGVNKLTFKRINIIQSSNNYNGYHAHRQPPSHSKKAAAHRHWCQQAHV